MNLTLLAFTSYKMMVHFISLVNQYIFHLLLQMYMECITEQIVKRVFLIFSSFFQPLMQGEYLKLMTFPLFIEPGHNCTRILHFLQFIT